ncbi:radical SAM protein [bacterium]|nr:radical SAM protein [bacterium]
MPNYLNLAKNFVVNASNDRPVNSSTEIRLTYLCTQRCRQCVIPFKGTDPKWLTFDQFRFIGERLREYGSYVGFISGGEVTLVPDLDKILLEAKKIFPIATTLVTGLYNKPEIIKPIAELALANDINIQTSLDGFDETGDDLRGSKDFFKVVYGNMKMISELKPKSSKSLLYVNIVMSRLNLHQVPKLIGYARDSGWNATIGMYHNLTESTKRNDEMFLVPGEKLDSLVSYLRKSKKVLNLDSYLAGIPEFVRTQKTNICAYKQSKVLSSRLLVMENGDVHLCKGNPIGNLFENDLEQIFESHTFRERLKEYEKCEGCWTTCYTQRYLLTHPKNFQELKNNFFKISGLKSEKIS